MKESPMNDMRRVHAEQLMSSLELSLPPVAIAFCDVGPDDVPMFEGVVPAGCAFWPQATARTCATWPQLPMRSRRRVSLPRIGCLRSFRACEL